MVQGGRSASPPKRQLGFAPGREEVMLNLAALARTFVVALLAPCVTSSSPTEHGVYLRLR